MQIAIEGEKGCPGNKVSEETIGAPLCGELTQSFGVGEGGWSAFVRGLALRPCHLTHRKPSANECA